MENKQSKTEGTEEGKELEMPTVAIVMGMAGSGKSSLVRSMRAYCKEHKEVSYLINLDPAVLQGDEEPGGDKEQEDKRKTKEKFDVLPYKPHIDIRDTVNYKELMKQYQLGPNGAIVTALNLFATRFNGVMEILEKRVRKNHDNPKKRLKYVLVDTPGQIEVFTWSASGTIITESLASKFPTVLLFVVDSLRCMDPTTFVSNMLYACSIMYKTRLPLVLCFNKSDLSDPGPLLEWLQDEEALEDELYKRRQSGEYMNDLTQSFSLVLSRFYEVLSHAKVSAETGSGMKELLGQVTGLRDEYLQVYVPLLEARKEASREREEKEKQSFVEENLARLEKDGQSTAGPPPPQE